MYEGDLQEGELEIGQVSATIRDIRPAGDILRDMVMECKEILYRLGSQQ